MEKTLEWLVTQQEQMQEALQSVQESHQTERQALLTWQAEQQESLRDFIREQSSMQQQLLRRVASTARGDGAQMPGLGLCKMGPADDPEAFLGIFERVAMGASWERPTWALRLAPYLAGEAQAAYMALSEEQAQNYEMVKAAILDQVGQSAKKYRKRFWLARWTAAVQPRAFAQRLVDWATCRLRHETQTEPEDKEMAEKVYEALNTNSMQESIYSTLDRKQ
ncbi:uncharacterized protein LOC142823381 [Pelodiscus sinensis]|uniref:uncharacterized protein LOC142823381 n=1 Tax=Pelodiscus sinensis TaxID=13735 RepID=UPI003F6C0DFA